RLEPLESWSQFGRNRDPLGNWFGCQNAKPMFHFVLPDRYLRRNPFVAPPSSWTLISDEPGQRPVFPQSRPGKFFHASQAGRFTSANSAMIYGDELLGEDFVGNSFVSEPVHNLVHREIVERDGATFKSHKPADETHSEFLASDDTWFRPNMIRTGPDGALWVADMYREIIEHPHWVSDELKPLVDVRAGCDRGRIYRIYPQGASLRAVPRIDQLEAGELVELLSSPNMTVRDMAHMRIVHEQLRDAVAPLKALAASGDRETARVQALSVLDGLGAVDEDVLYAALDDKSPWVRAAAVRLCESRKGGLTPLNSAESDPAVRLQTALSLGEFALPIGGTLLGEMARAHGRDAYLAAAVNSSLRKENLGPYADALLADSREPVAAPLLEGLIATVIGLED
ncbi:MAG: hypothetical protein KDA41_12605, partial [Planctomycetales bacterium]|nr:hypothetical protein [Planctomycetales bacterium]